MKIDVDNMTDTCRAKIAMCLCHSMSWLHDIISSHGLTPFFSWPVTNNFMT